MSNMPAKRQNNSISTKQFFRKDAVQEKFEEMLGNKAQGFMTSVLQCVNNSKHLRNADPTSVYNAAMTAAVLDLPINQNLGFAYIVPYKGQAQFQMGYKGYIQLAQRSGLYKTISATEVYEGQVAKADPLKGYEFDWDSKESDKVIGYVSYFELLNGFSKPFYMTVQDIEDHAQEYSQSYRKGYGPWTDNFEGMALKTVLKLLITKFGPMTIDMQQAATFDQAVVKDVENQEVDYVDNVHTDGNDIGKQIAGDVMGSDDESSEKEPEDVEEAEQAEAEDVETFKPSKRQREYLLDRAGYLTDDKRHKHNQSALVKFINSKNEFTEDEWKEWREAVTKAEKKAKEEEKAKDRK